MAKFSTGLRNDVLSNTSLRSLLNGGFIHIYAGAVPSDADQPIGSVTRLVTLSVDGLGGGLTLSTTAENGSIPKTSAEVWKGTNDATGTATFFRFVSGSDTGALSTTLPRVQGTVGAAGTDMLVANPLLTSSEEFILNYFVVALPTL